MADRDGEQEKVKGICAVGICLDDGEDNDDIDGWWHHFYFKC